MKRIFLAMTLILAFALPSFGASKIPVGTAAEFLEGDILDTGRIHAVFYDTDGDGSCTDGTTYATYVNTLQVPDATTEYELHDGIGGAYTTSTSGSTAFIQSESFSNVTSLVWTISSATFTDADCIVYYYDTDDDDEASTGDVALHQQDITSISPVAEDVPVTHPADDASNALFRMTVP